MFDNITKEMVASLSSASLKRFNYIKDSLEKGTITSPLILQRFSDLAFSLARRRLRDDVNLEIVKPLTEIFNKYLQSIENSLTIDLKMKSLIDETKLDFWYAGGNRNFSSRRLASYLIKQQNS